MKRLIVTVIALAVVSPLMAAEKGKHLFILSGQSNMAGLKPEISFIPAVNAEFGKDNVIVVKSAQGGQPIRRWYKDWKLAEGANRRGIGDLYAVLMTKVNAAIKGQEIASVTFVWMQGERDAREKLGDRYAEAFKGVIAQLRKDLQRDDVNFVIGRISDFDMNNKRYPHWTKIREVQVALAEADPRGEWVDTDKLNGSKNGLHYSREGYETLGRLFAQKAIDLVKEKR